ncbi:methionyl-tRNA formyltransferase [Amnibacterium endophyticum]|uniref:Methionyl-tRNA formyltransferase n=1 Tax=Amnibacterium endophyticum TaxID=2109337 RepID=A0ABW4LCR9_9MICO
MRLIFAGTPDAAVPALEAFAASQHEIVRVVTRPPAPLGRKRVVMPSPVHAAADRLGLPVLPAARLDADATARLTADAADLAVVVAYGGLVREPLLSAPVHGWINLHFSLLPRWRGAAPVQHALIAGDRTTGVDVFRLEAGLDTGPVVAREAVPIVPDETAAALLPRLAGIGARVLAAAVDRIADGSAAFAPQAGAATAAPKLSLDDGRLDWTLPAQRVHDRYRGCTPEPGAWTTAGERRLKVLEAALAPEAALDPGELGGEREVLVGCGEGALPLLRVQPEGRGAMPAADWRRGLGAAVRLS